MTDQDAIARFIAIETLGRLSSPQLYDPERGAQNFKLFYENLTSKSRWAVTRLGVIAGYITPGQQVRPRFRRISADRLQTIMENRIRDADDAVVARIDTALHGLFEQRHKLASEHRARWSDQPAPDMTEQRRAFGNPVSALRALYKGQEHDPALRPFMTAYYQQSLL